MAPTLKSTEAEGSKSDHHRQPRMEMNNSRINVVSRHNAHTTPANSSQTQRVGGSSSLAATHQNNEVVRTELATAALEQHENQAVPNRWSGYCPKLVVSFVSPLFRLVGAITQPRRIPDNQSQQHALNQTLAQISEQVQSFKDHEAQLNATVEELRGTLGQIRKEIKIRRNRVKAEKAEGKPKRCLSKYNFYIKEEQKNLKASGSNKNAVRDEGVQMKWKMMSAQEKSMRYGHLVTEDKDRVAREMKIWNESQRNPADDRKPAAKPTPEELAATAVSDHPHETTVAALAVEGPGDSDGGHKLSPYEQLRERNVARNEERMRSLGLLSKSTTVVEARDSSKKRKKKRKNASDTPPRQSPRKPCHNLLNDSSSGSAALQFPVGHEFLHSVPPSNYHGGYMCWAVVSKVDGKCEYSGVSSSFFSFVFLSLLTL